ncbi:MAG TPA: hypothetical protein VIQ62_10435 [Burkholderiales bacterium]
MHGDDKNNPLHAAAPVNPAHYTPPTLEHADRVIQRLMRHYRKKTTVECREALAAMYGHADWQSMQSAIAAGTDASPYDEHAASHVVQARERQQYDAVLVHLGGMTDGVLQAARKLDQVVLSSTVHTLSQRHDLQYNQRRLERARYAYHIVYAKEVVHEVRPSGSEALAIPVDDDEIDLILRVDLLPRALEAWLAHHRPLLKRWGAIVGRIPVRQRCPTELLDFAHAWGELALMHAVDIPKALQVYPLVLCAKWYAWLACLSAPALQADLAVLDAPRAAEDARSRARRALSDAIGEEEARFLLTQPREDFRALSSSAREQQMKAGHAALRRWMSDAATEHTVRNILTSPSWLALTPVIRGG